jgi:hypothetical protein
MPMMRRTAHHHAGLRPPGRHPLPGVRRVQRQGLRRPHRRLRQPRSDHHGCLLPRRQAAGSQEKSRHRRGKAAEDGQKSWTRCSSGSAIPASTRPDPHGRGPGLLCQRPAEGLLRRPGRTRKDEFRGPAVSDVHQRHHRQTQGLPARHRRLPGLRDRHLQVRPGHPSRGCLLVHGRHRLDHRTLLHRLRPLASVPHR